MKFIAIAVLAILAALVTTVGTVPTGETNAFRLARGLPPLPPIKRATAAYPAKKGHPSGSPGQCYTGSALCCNYISQPRDSSLKRILEKLNIRHLPGDIDVGVTCSPLAIVGGHPNCNKNPVCCKNNNFHGLIAIDCSPIH